MSETRQGSAESEITVRQEIGTARVDIWAAENRILEKIALKTSADRNEVSEECLQSLKKRIPDPSPSGERTTILTWSGCKLAMSWKDTFHVVASSSYDVVLGSEASDKLLEAQRSSQALLALAEKEKQKREEEDHRKAKLEANRLRQQQEQKERARKIQEEMQRKTASPAA